jgi:hypothetical protein
LAVAFKPTVIPHAIIKGGFSSVAKRWMAEVVGKGDRADGTDVRQMVECRMGSEVITELPLNSFGDLRRFE